MPEGMWSGRCPLPVNRYSRRSVTIFVSMGVVVQVPNLVGIENVDIAKQRLEAVNLTLGSVTEEADPAESVPPGAVLRQNSPSGTLAKKFSAVDIVLQSKQTIQGSIPHSDSGTGRHPGPAG